MSGSVSIVVIPTNALQSHGTPTYHAMAGIEVDPDAETYALLTRCGKTDYRHRTTTRGLGHTEWSVEVDWPHLARVHAEKFARPCKRCFPVEVSNGR